MKLIGFCVGRLSQLFLSVRCWKWDLGTHMCKFLTKERVGRLILLPIQLISSTDNEFGGEKNISVVYISVV